MALPPLLRREGKGRIIMQIIGCKGRGEEGIALRCFYGDTGFVKPPKDGRFSLGASA